MAPRVVVIGLDCVPPALAFERYRELMPCLGALMESGAWGAMRSTTPPITVPAWASMTTGRDPGELGLYGFRDRVPDSYEMRVATSADVRHKRVWDLLGDAGHRVAALFVPPGYPVTPVRGCAVSCLLTPGPDAAWAFPAGLKAELTDLAGPFIPDVEGYRTHDPLAVVTRARAMTDQHFRYARHVLTAKRPDFLMMVAIGPDRVHHAAWHAMDPAHPRHDPDSELAAAARDAYAALDARVGELVDAAGDAAVLVVSDHGARVMEGGVRINEHLRREGWLTLSTDPARPVPLADAGVDWSRTRAFAEGGYYARVWLNLSGREPAGTVPPSAYEEERSRLARVLAAMEGPEGPLGNVVLRPEELYREVRGRPPDLLVLPGDLRYRALGGVGPGPLLTPGDDRGHDSCNHDRDGIFVMRGGRARGTLRGVEIEDVARTVLELMDVPAPVAMGGRSRAVG